MCGNQGTKLLKRESSGVTQLLGIPAGTRAQSSDPDWNRDRKSLYAEHGFQSQAAWIQMLALPLTGCVLLGKLINLSVPLFSPPEMSIVIIPTSEGRGENELNSYLLSSGTKMVSIKVSFISIINFR